MEHLKYPIGKFDSSWQERPLDELRSVIENFPKNLKNLIQDVEPRLLLNVYRPGGWTAIQVIHHCADSHMNAFIRMKLALTEERPTIMPYDEQLWALTDDGMDTDVQHSISLLSGLHSKWGTLISSLSEEDMNKCFYHPANKRDYSIATVAALYAWHSEHHLAHIRLSINNKI